MNGLSPNPAQASLLACATVGVGGVFAGCHGLWVRIYKTHAQHL